MSASPVAGESSEDRRGPQAAARQLDLGECLFAAKKISLEELERARRLCKDTGARLDAVLTGLGVIGEREIAEAVAAACNLPIARADDFPAAPVLSEAFSRQFLKESRVIPLADHAEAAAVAFVNPLEPGLLDAVRFAVRKNVRCYVTCLADFEHAFRRLYQDGSSAMQELADGAALPADEPTAEDIERLGDIASEAPVVRLVNQLITQAVEARASDIHLEPMDGGLRVRYRVDGLLRHVEAPPAALADALVSRIKIMARMNIAERRLPQDGRIRLSVRGQDVDLRVAATPTLHGESVVLRVLDRKGIELDFRALGFDEPTVRQFRDVLNRPHGIALVTGPTGSGKTTTLYTALMELNTPDKKILTVEDPVEIQLKGVNQAQIKPQIGHTFANALRSFLRQDPDIMMVGEIRDVETAQIAVQAALTGHLVLSTLHTNDAAGAMTRLLDMGVADYLLTSTINGVVSQRLIRTLCTGCRVPYSPSEALVERLQLTDVRADAQPALYRAGGCAECGGSGYRGRSALVEIIPMSDEIRRLVLRHAPAGDIRACAVELGTQTLYRQGLRKAAAGLTTIEEVIRVTKMD